MNPRQGPLGRMLHIRETSWGVDPTTPNKILMPLHAKEGFKTDQPRNQAVGYDGTFDSWGSYKGKIDATGPREMSMDYLYLGNDLMDIMGPDGYTRNGGLHRWTSMSLPKSYQLQKEYTQATAIVHRYPGIFATMFDIAGAVEGQQAYTVSQMGKGSEARADIAGSVLVNTLLKKGFSYFDGSITKDGVSLANVSTYDMKIDRKVTRKDGQFQAGQAAAISFGKPVVEGNLGLIFSTDDGDTFYDQAINDTIVSLSCLWANKPLSANPTMFVRMTMGAVLFSRAEAGVGGDEIPDQTQHFLAEIPAAYNGASAIGTIAGPYLIDGTHQVVSVKFQGGATINVTLTNGAARTAAQIATQLNADVTFAAAGTAYDLNGRLEIVSDDVTSSSSVQWQTATANSAHTVLGFTTTTFTGYAPSQLYVELLNTQTTDYE